jgi:multidrug resistance protein
LDIAQRIPTEAQIDSDTDSVRKEEDDGGKYGVEEKEMFEPVEGPGDDSKLPETLSSYTLKKYPWRPYATQFEDILNNKYRGSGTAESPYLVTWLDHDPENPKQWSKPRQWSILGLASMLSLCVSLASSGYTGALPQVVEQFHCSEEVALLGLSLMLVGYAFGPLIWAPLSETFGRRKILFPTLAIYIFWSALCCASQNVQTLLVFRFLAGLFGSSTLAIPGGIVADVFPAETRGAALVMFTAAPFLGPALGPIAGGFLGESAGWRWVMALLALFALLVTTVCFILIPESFAPILLRARAKTLSEVTGKVYLTPMDAEQTLSVHQLMRNAIVRPWILLFLEPIVLILTVRPHGTSSLIGANLFPGVRST